MAGALAALSFLPAPAAVAATKKKRATASKTKATTPKPVFKATPATAPAPAPAETLTSARVNEVGWLETAGDGRWWMYGPGTMSKGRKTIVAWELRNGAWQRLAEMPALPWPGDVQLGESISFGGRQMVTGVVNGPTKVPFVTSFDGKNWGTPVSLPTFPDESAASAVRMQTNGSMAMIWDNGGDRPRAWTSVDGTSWTRATFPLAEAGTTTLADVVFGPNLVALGHVNLGAAGFKSIAWTSADGASWTPYSSGLFDPARGTAVMSLSWDGVRYHATHAEKPGWIGLRVGSSLEQWDEDYSTISLSAGSMRSRSGKTLLVDPSAVGLRTLTLDAAGDWTGTGVPGLKNGPDVRYGVSAQGGLLFHAHANVVCIHSSSALDAPFTPVAVPDEIRAGYRVA